MQITSYEIADCWTEEEILIFRKKLCEDIKVFNEGLEIKIERLKNTKINEPAEA